MLREKLLSLFKEYEPEVQSVIAKVLELEWSKISQTKPRVNEEIRDIIDKEVRKSGHED